MVHVFVCHCCCFASQLLSVQHIVYIFVCHCFALTPSFSSLSFFVLLSCLSRSGSFCILSFRFFYLHISSTGVPSSRVVTPLSLTVYYCFCLCSSLSCLVFVLFCFVSSRLSLSLSLISLYRSTSILFLCPAHFSPCLSSSKPFPQSPATRWRCERWALT